MRLTRVALRVLIIRALFAAKEATRSLTQGLAPPSIDSTANASFWDRIGGQIGMVSWTWVERIERSEEISMKLKVTAGHRDCRF